MPPSGLTPPGCGTGGENADAPSPLNDFSGGCDGDMGVARGEGAIGAMGGSPPAIGATPTIVPFNLLGPARAPGGGGTPTAEGFGGTAAAGVGGRGVNSEPG